MNLAATSSITTFITHTPIDWIIIAVLLVVIFLDAFNAGTGRAAALTLAMPLTLVIWKLLPQAAIVGGAIAGISTPLPQAGIFVGLLVLVYFLVYRMVYAYSAGGGGALAAAVAALCAVAVPLAVWLQVPALHSIWHFSPQIDAIFGTAYTFWWLIGGYILTAFVRS